MDYRHEVQQEDPRSHQYLPTVHILYAPTLSSARDARETFEGRPDYCLVRGWSHERGHMIEGYILKSGKAAFEKDFPASKPVDRDRVEFDRKADRLSPKKRSATNAETNAQLDLVGGGGRPTVARVTAPKILAATPKAARQAVDSEDPLRSAPKARQQEPRGYSKDPDLPQSSRRAEAQYSLQRVPE